MSNYQKINNNCIIQEYFGQTTEIKKLNAQKKGLRRWWHYSVVNFKGRRWEPLN